MIEVYYIFIQPAPGVLIVWLYFVITWRGKVENTLVSVNVD